MEILNQQNLMIILKTLSKVQQNKGAVATPKTQIPQAPSPMPSLVTSSQFQENLQAQAMNRTEHAAMAKDLLALPKDMKELLAMLVFKNASPQDVVKLLQTKNIKLTPEMFQQLLDTNSKEVISKLIKLMQQGGNAQNYDQLKQLMALVNQLVPAKDAQPQEILRHVLLLYLPWLPLADQQDVQIRFEKKKSGESGEDDGIAMVIYISTVNLGRFKATIMIDKNNHLDIHIEHVSEKTEGLSDKDKEVKKETLKKILKALNSEMKEEKYDAKTYFSEVKQEKFKESGKREVTISTVNSISPAVLMASQKIARVILEFDERISLLEVRKNK